MDKLTKFEWTVLIVVALLLCNPTAHADEIKPSLKERDPVLHHVIVDGSILAVCAALLGNPVPALHLIGTSGIFIEAGEFWMWSKNDFALPKPTVVVATPAEKVATAQ